MSASEVSGELNVRRWKPGCLPPHQNCPACENGDNAIFPGWCQRCGGRTRELLGVPSLRATARCTSRTKKGVGRIAPVADEDRRGNSKLEQPQ